ncbi:MAG: AAA family ATPase [Spirochaetaceae bacterium]|nr:AAA family ATPase [Spirochaetaceae bacterium]
MSTTPVLTFFNNKGGVGKTSLIYHVSWMLSELGYKVLVVDLDPQANLTAAFLSERRLEKLWDEPAGGRGNTIYQCVERLAAVGDIRDPALFRVANELFFLAGDLALSGFEDLLSTEWPNCLGSQNLFRPFRVITSFWQVIQRGAKRSEAQIVLVDVGPSLGAVNRSALIATDFVVVPLAADLFSRQGLRNLGPTLRQWRADWQKRRDNWEAPEFALPVGDMLPIGYLIQQHGVRLSRPVAAYDRWVRRMPAEYSASVLGVPTTSRRSDPDADENAIATVKHYRSLVPLAQDARKPIFALTPADGAIGSHAAVARDAFHDFEQLTREILGRIKQERGLRRRARAQRVPLA